MRRKKTWKRILLLVVALIVIIQFIRPEPNTAAGLAAQDITLHYAVPAPVQQVLRRSCYDCHSDNTVYPWYNNIQPVAWILDDHVREGKKELNFSAFASYAPKKAAHKLDEVIAETGEHEMPIASYLRLHPETKLSDSEVKLIADWATSLADSIRRANHLPMP